ncbi:glutamic-type intramembrane protease PrsW [Paenibacillus yanchengensis]|uniref:Protease PrsW n=1 Tax=Paenibacillus yanchengensis TaxID=2035833 RepID=A0ABW4YK15_9BACL
MLLFSLLSVAIAPGLSLLTYLYLRDKYDAEPVHIVVKMFVMGIIILIPIMVIQRGLQLWAADLPWIVSYIESAGVEEFFKWFILYHFIFNHVEFDEPYDGILYAAAISLGFATMENILYAIFTPVSFSMMFTRALLPVAGHAIFGILMGYYLGKAKFSKRRKYYLFISISVPVLLHGTYDLILLSLPATWIWYLLPFMIFIWIWGLRKMERAHARSPFKLYIKEDEVNY